MKTRTKWLIGAGAAIVVVAALGSANNEEPELVAEATTTTTTVAPVTTEAPTTAPTPTTTLSVTTTTVAPVTTTTEFELNPEVLFVVAARMTMEDEYPSYDFSDEEYLDLGYTMCETMGAAIDSGTSPQTFLMDLLGLADTQDDPGAAAYLLGIAVVGAGDTLCLEYQWFSDAVLEASG